MSLHLLVNTYLYSACRTVSKKLDTNANFATSLEEGGFSGTSGKQKPSHVCISARENGPVKRNVLHGLKYDNELQRVNALKYDNVSFYCNFTSNDKCNTYTFPNQHCVPSYAKTMALSYILEPDST